MTNTSTRHLDPLAQSSDAEVIRRSIDDPARFDALFTRHAQAIHAFACARVGPVNAEDITAETFAAAFRSRANFDPRATSARPWLYGIAANTLRRHHEHEARWLRRQHEHSEARVVDDPAASDDRLDAARLAPRLTAALATLSLGERDVLLLHVLSELTHQEIAQVLGIRRGTAKSRLSRGRARLRTTFPELVDHIDHARRGGNHD